MQVLYIMIINERRIKKKYIKSFYRKNLLCSEIQLSDRIREIENLSSHFGFIPKTIFLYKNDRILYIQDFVVRKVPRLEEKLELLKSFSCNLDLLSQYGFVHGDIHKNNVIFDGDKLVLLDLEPCFFQLKYNKSTLKSSIPKQSLNDIQKKTITSETDKIGFFLFCYSFMKMTFFSIPIKKVSSLRKSLEYEYLPLKEKEFVKLKFNSIFNLFVNETKSNYLE